VQDVKHLLRDLARQRQQQQLSRPGAEGQWRGIDGGSPREGAGQGTGQGMDEAISIVAELFLGIRNAMSDGAAELKHQEGRLKADIAELRKAVSSAIYLMICASSYYQIYVCVCGRYLRR
jgi:hypothetical protein